MSAQKSLATVSGDQPYYIARPPVESRRGALVLPAWWGLNSFFKQFCRRLAKEGFVALALDYYHGKIALQLARLSIGDRRFDANRPSR